MWHLARELKREKYDTTIVLHQFFIFAVFAWLAGIPSRIGLDRNGEGFALTTRIPRPQAKMHRVAEYLSTLAPFNANIEGLTPSITIDEQSIPIAQDMVRKMAGGRDTSKLIVLLPTGGTNTAATEVASNIVTKRWPADYYAALAKCLVEDGHPVMVLGGPGENNLRPACGEDQPGYKVLLGQTDLRTTMALIKQASLVVTNDSGPMHIAAALNTPVIAVFGPTDPAIVGPYSPKAVVLKGEEACAPCFRDDVFPNIVPACEHQRCMRSVTVDVVYKAAKELLSAHAPI